MVRLLICDLDNTLYDWVGYFVDAFYAMVDEVVRITDCDRETLLDDFREVHRKHHDAEHPFSVLETKTIQRLYPGRSRAELVAILDPALHAFNSARKRRLALYSTVRETLEELHSRQVILVAHTESKLYAVVDRLTRLKIDHFFAHIYCRERTPVPHPKGTAPDEYLSRFSMSRVSELKHHQRKPNEEVLLEICEREGIDPAAAAYVGDSIVRDMLMAKRARVTAVWAKYGTQHAAGAYERLVRISHWTPEDVARERLLYREAAGIEPDVVLETRFAEILRFV